MDRVVARAMDEYGRLDVLVNNAGGSPPVDAATASPRFSTSIIALNLVAPLVFSQRVNAVMQKQAEGGSIVNIASVSGLRPSPGTAAYGAAKAGLLNLTESLAVEWAPKVRVNAIAAGPAPDRAIRPPLRGRRGYGAGRRDDPARSTRGARGRGRRVPVPGVVAGEVRERGDGGGARGRGAAKAFLEAAKAKDSSARARLIDRSANGDGSSRNGAAARARAPRRSARRPTTSVGHPALRLHDLDVLRRLVART